MDLIDVGEWVKLSVRWLHVFAAILWIGQTYLFSFFEKAVRPRVGGSASAPEQAWLIHSGGFYVVEKQRLPERLPEQLHWFKWEAAATWMSGVLLLVLTYYMGGLLVEPDQRYDVGLTVGIASMIVGWFVYDGLVRSPLGKNELAFATVGFFLILGSLIAFRQVLSTRAAYIQVGAVIGTIMTANVWLRILPSQRQMLAALTAGRTPDSAVMATGPLRTQHNTFLVVPLIFIMISNHYPTISYGNRYAVLVLGVMLLVGWGVAKVVQDWRS